MKKNPPPPQALERHRPFSRTPCPIKNQTSQSNVISVKNFKETRGGVDEPEKALPALDIALEVFEERLHPAGVPRRHVRLPLLPRQPLHPGGGAGALFGTVVLHLWSSFMMLLLLLLMMVIIVLIDHHDD